jgi:hypothetical protein
LADEGHRQLEIATRLSPRDHTQAANLSIEGLCHLVAGRYAEAVTAERRAVQLRPNFGTAWRTLAAAAGLAGDLELERNHAPAIGQRFEFGRRAEVGEQSTHLCARSSAQHRVAQRIDVWCGLWSDGSRATFHALSD